MKKIFMAVCICTLLAGCGKENIENSSAVEVTEIVTEQAETEVTTEEIAENTTADVNITIDEAYEMLWSMIKEDRENQQLSYDRTQDYGERQCYVFQEYYDCDTHRATTGWYAVDVKTGECFTPMPELVPFETEASEN